MYAYTNILSDDTPAQTENFKIRVQIPSEFRVLSPEFSFLKSVSIPCKSVSKNSSWPFANSRRDDDVASQRVVVKKILSIL